VRTEQFIAPNAAAVDANAHFTHEAPAALN
jgi:hypothetical protein